jgi:hypothetical protein
MRKTMMAHCDDVAGGWGVLMGKAVKVSERWQAGDERKNMNMQGQQYSEVACAAHTLHVTGGWT